MLRVVHFAKFYFPDVGGIESVASSLARGAAGFGHEVTVVCFGKTPAKRDEVIDGVRVVRSPIRKLIASQPLALSYLILCLRKAHDADVIHLHAPNMLAALASLFIGKKPRLLVHWHSDVINKGWWGKLVQPLEAALLRRADSIVATSQAYADASPTLQAFHNKITVVPIGVPDAREADTITGVESELPQEMKETIAGKRLILAVGRLIPYKGFDVLIKAAKDMRDDAIVVIVGDGPLQGKLRNAISMMGVSKRVHLAGRLSDGALHALFAKASLYCLSSTSRAEAFGVVLLEAMAYRLPIVATDIPGSGVPWVNQHGVSGINVPVGDAEALARACNQILSSEHERQKFADGARARFMTEFTEEVSVKKIMATYDRLAEA